MTCINLSPPQFRFTNNTFFRTTPPPSWTARRWAILRAFWSVRRDVWDARESRLRAKWESYG